MSTKQLSRSNAAGEGLGARLAARARKWGAAFSLALVFYVAAAAGFSGYFTKWAFREGTGLAADAIADGTADRPFIYRQLVPQLAKRLSGLVSQERKQHLIQDGYLAYHGPELFFSNSHPPADLEKRFVYHVMYFLSFACLFLALPLMFRLCRDLGSSFSTSVLVPLIFAQFFPLFMTRGGYVYDAAEILMLVGAVTLALRGHWSGLLILSAVATYNKEAFFFFIPTLYPLLRSKLSARASLLSVGACGLISGCVYLGLRHAYAHNPGMTSEWQLWENLAFYANPKNYFGYEANYGLPTARGLSLPHLVLIGVLVGTAWKLLPRPFRLHTYLALTVNLPLFLMFCWRDELRNLSMLYPSLIALMTFTLSRANDELSIAPDETSAPHPRATRADAVEQAPATQPTA